MNGQKQVFSIARWPSSRLGHLFEEANALDEVVEYAINWFEQTLVPKTSLVVARAHKQIVEDVKAAIQSLTEDGIAALARSTILSFAMKRRR